MSDKKSVSTNPDEEETTPTLKDLEKHVDSKLIYRDSGPAFNDNWAKKLCELFSSYKNTLWGINLDNISTSREELLNLIKNLKVLKKLRNLLIKHSDVGDEGLIALSQEKEVLQRLGMISLWGSNFTDEGFMVFTESLKYMHSLSYLYLTQTAISDKGAEALARNMWYCRLIRVLYVNGTLMSDVGVTEIIKSTRHLSRVETVCLMSNRLSADSYHCADYRSKVEQLKGIIEYVKRATKNDDVDITVNHVHNSFIYTKFEKCGKIEVEGDYCEKIFDEEDEKEVKKELENESEMEIDDEDE